MKVDAVEMGERPAAWTLARRYAPAGTKVLAELLEQQDFADIGLIVLDWSNQIEAVPDEAAKPVLHIRVYKHLSEYTVNNTLRVDARLDVEDVFGNDEMSAEVMVDLVRELRDKVEQQVTMRRQN